METGRLTADRVPSGVNRIVLHAALFPHQKKKKRMRKGKRRARSRERVERVRLLDKRRWRVRGSFVRISFGAFGSGPLLCFKAVMFFDSSQQLSKSVVRPNWFDQQQQQPTVIVYAVSDLLPVSQPHQWIHSAERYVTLRHLTECMYVHKVSLQTRKRAGGMWTQSI